MGIASTNVTMVSFQQLATKTVGLQPSSPAHSAMLRRPTPDV